MFMIATVTKVSLRLLLNPIALDLNFSTEEILNILIYFAWFVKIEDFFLQNSIYVLLLIIGGSVTITW